jgi:uncharacterized protein (TIGR03118 family)
MSAAFSFRLSPETGWDDNIKRWSILSLTLATAPLTSVTNEAKTHRPGLVKLTADGLSDSATLGRLKTHDKTFDVSPASELHNFAVASGRPVPEGIHRQLQKKISGTAGEKHRKPKQACLSEDVIAPILNRQGARSGGALEVIYQNQKPRRINMNMLRRLAASTILNLILGAACFAQNYTQTNLVSNKPEVAPVVDPRLINAWGLSRGSGSPWWVSDQATGVSTLYNGAGGKQSLVVTIPPADPKKTKTGSPTGTTFNGSQTDFLLSPGNPAVFLFSTVDGTIAGWNPNMAAPQGATAPSTHAVTVVKTTDGSSYTGLTSAFIDSKRYLYAANLTEGRVDVYDNAFHLVTLPSEHFDQGSSDQSGPSPENPFMDDQLPPHYVPFNVQAIGNEIVVAYALHEEGSRFETDGPGLSFVDIYSSSGRLLRVWNTVIG